VNPATVGIAFVAALALLFLVAFVADEIVALWRRLQLWLIWRTIRKLQKTVNRLTIPTPSSSESHE
jgi:hypothetical protein